MNELKVEIKNEEMKCYRKKAADETSPIIVELKTEALKAVILQARKERGPIKIKECQLKGKNNSIYINEQLTMTLNKLSYEARTLKKENKIKYAWTRDGNIYIRKTDTSNKIKVTTLQDLQKLE